MPSTEMNSDAASMGVIVRVNGPVVEAVNLAGAGMLEVVEVGDDRLIGEIIRLQGDRATIQVYENTSGLKPGSAVRATGSPLCVNLGPGMIGNIYDGIQRPLREIRAKSGVYIRRGEKVPPLDEEKKWRFVPTVKAGEEVKPGTIFGKIQETPAVEHRLGVAPGVEGTVAHVVDAGEYCISDVVLAVETGHGVHEQTMVQRWPARQGRPYRKKTVSTEPLLTGQRIIDTFFPIAKGGTAAIPGGFGTGKTMTQHALAKWSDADIIVYIGCGERGNEMTEVLTDFPKLIDPRSGRPLLERTILIANTSNMPVAAREVCIYTGTTMAEYFRDMGYHVAIMADSTSRWAEALRELSGRLEEMPADEGFPAYLATRLADFYERAGIVDTLNGERGSVSMIGAVSPPGGDFSEPVTQHTKRFIRAFWALDRQLANARHYPSISWLDSYSEYVPDVEAWWAKEHPDWASLRTEALDLLQREAKLQQIVKLVGPDALPDSQRLVLFVADMLKNGFLQQNAFDEIDMYCPPGKQIALLQIMMTIYRRGRTIIEKGAPLLRLRDLPSMQGVIRAKTTIPNDDTAGMEQLATRVNQEMDELEKGFA